MKESTVTALIVTARVVVVLGCIILVIVARMSVGWGSLALMLIALGVLLGVLWSYNRKFR